MDICIQPEGFLLSQTPLGSKIDLLVWSYESDATLNQSLSSIEKSVPATRICHKIMVDGGSSDDTEKIARQHDWDFYVTRPGIPVQANFGLGLVDTDNYASFEHDIILSPNWLTRMERLLQPSDVAVAQGIRLSKGVPSLEALDRWSNLQERSFYSIDNDLYRTDVIRNVGGYPYDCPMSADGFLREKLLAKGFRWITDNGCISWHLRSSFPDYLRHIVRQIQRANFLWESEFARPLIARRLRILLTSPVVSAWIAGKTHTPSLLIDYPLLRYVVLVTTSLTSKHKKLIVRPRLADETLRA